MKSVYTLVPPVYDKVVRVAVNNNFNCTGAEYRQLASFVKDNPTRYFFVNSNIKTPGLLTLNDHRYKAVVTVNPDLIVRESEILKLYDLDRENVAFVRVKYIPESQPIVDLIQELGEAQYPTVVTLQRFNSKVMLEKYGVTKHYQFTHSRARLNKQALSKILPVVDRTPGVYVCDRSGLGCQGCGLCSTLTVGQRLPLASLNLSSSGICGYSCPDCYAKTMQNFLRKMGRIVIKYDVIKQNEKQAGRTEHIKKERALLLK